jgi:predicted esterase
MRSQATAEVVHGFAKAWQKSLPGGPETPLLVIHGDMDQVVPLAHGK